MFFAGFASLQATQAYQVGNKALAKDLAFKGRYHAEQMKAAHAHASEAIFAQRNGVSPMAMHPSSGGGNQPLLIDLHGLHVAEALAFLRCACCCRAPEVLCI